MQLKLRADAQRFPNATSRIAYVISRTAGRAQELLKGHVTNDGFVDLTDATDVLTILQNAYGVLTQKVLPEPNWRNFGRESITALGTLPSLMPSPTSFDRTPVPRRMPSSLESPTRLRNDYTSNKPPRTRLTSSSVSDAKPSTPA